MDATRVGWRDRRLGAVHSLDLPQGTLRYHDSGAGPAVVFVHGALVNANLWRRVVPQLAASHRCVALDLPLGCHLDPMPADADLSPPAIADLIADAIAAIGLDDITLVGNDTGGALCQLVATRRAERLARLVLTSCDAFDNFPPRAFRPMIPPLLVPGALFTTYQLARIGPLVQSIFRTLAKRPIEPEVMDTWVLPLLADAGVRRDVRKLLRGANSRYTLAAAERLRELAFPALIAWSAEDRFFPRAHAERLAELIPDARLVWIEDSRTFSAEDQPERLAALISEFIAQSATAQTSADGAMTRS